MGKGKARRLGRRTAITIIRDVDEMISSSLTSFIVPIPSSSSDAVSHDKKRVEWIGAR